MNLNIEQHAQQLHWFEKRKFSYSLRTVDVNTITTQAVPFSPNEHMFTPRRWFRCEWNENPTRQRHALQKRMWKNALIIFIHWKIAVKISFFLQSTDGIQMIQFVCITYTPCAPRFRRIGHHRFDVFRFHFVVASHVSVFHRARSLNAWTILFFC